MIGWLGLAYPWVKAAHLIFVIFWMAGLFMLPRYLVYHQEALARPDEAGVWVERETKLRRIILTPAMIGEAGFVNAKVEPILGGLVAIHSGWKI